MRACTISVAFVLIFSSNYQETVAKSKKPDAQCQNCYDGLKKCKSLPFYDHNELFVFTKFTKCMMPAYKEFESQTNIQLPTVLTDFTVDGPLDSTEINGKFLWDCLDESLRGDDCSDCHQRHLAAKYKLDVAKHNCDNLVDTIYENGEDMEPVDYTRVYFPELPPSPPPYEPQPV